MATEADLRMPGAPVPALPTQLPVAETDDVEMGGYVDYFGFDDTETFMLPDGKQWILCKKLNEGERAQYERTTSRDVSFNRRNDDAKIKIDASTDRHELIKLSVQDWHIVRRNLNTKQFEPAAFNKNGEGSMFMQWLRSTNPKIINDLYEFIRKMNPFLTEELTVAQIDEELSKLNTLREEAVERDAAKKSS